MSSGLWLGSNTGEAREPSKIDTSAAHIARVYNYWLGGKDNFAADREAGDLALRAYPDMGSSVRANRAFLRRTVHYLAADEGIRQFLDIGTGLPSANNTHEVAQSVAPDSRVVYVDDDPVVLTHARALLSSGPEGATGYLDADARDVGKILAESAQLLDFSKPVGIMLVAMLHCVPDADNPAGLVATLRDAVVPGSFVVISHPPNDMQRGAPGLREGIDKLNVLMAQPITPRSQQQVTDFFDGFDLLDPGVVPIQRWRPDSDEEAAARAGMWGGVARKP
jgi:hypothetical protein